jgi:hypothetical protein
VWAAEEYQRLPDWDGDLGEQSPATFGCHQSDGHLCSGWVAHRGDPVELLAVRIGVLSQAIDPEVLDYTTDVALFGSGQEACEHGMRDIHGPSAEAQEFARKIIRARGIGGVRGVILGLVAVLVALLAGCGDSPKVWACATTADDPPIVVEDSRCPTDRNVPPRDGVRWYSAPESDIGPDDVPVIGQPLDGDFHDLADQLDLDEAKKTTTAKPTPKTTTAKTTTAKPTPKTTSSPRPRSTT